MPVHNLLAAAPALTEAGAGFSAGFAKIRVPDAVSQKEPGPTDGDAPWSSVPLGFKQALLARTRQLDVRASSATSALPAQPVSAGSHGTRPMKALPAAQALGDLPSVEPPLVPAPLAATTPVTPAAVSAAMDARQTGTAAVSIDSAEKKPLGGRSTLDAAPLPSSIATRPSDAAPTQLSAPTVAVPLPAPLSGEPPLAAVPPVPAATMIGAFSELAATLAPGRKASTLVSEGSRAASGTLPAIAALIPDRPALPTEAARLASFIVAPRAEPGLVRTTPNSSSGSRRSTAQAGEASAIGSATTGPTAAGLGNIPASAALAAAPAPHPAGAEPPRLPEARPNPAPALQAASLPSPTEPGFSIDSRLLGPVSAALTPLNAAGDRLHVQFTVDRSATAALINSGSDRLDASLNAAGARLALLKVTVDVRAGLAATPLDLSRPVQSFEPHVSQPEQQTTSLAGAPSTLSWSATGGAPQDARPGAGGRGPPRDQQDRSTGQLRPLHAHNATEPTRDRFA